MVAQLDPFDLQQQILELEAALRQAQAQIEGVDSTKPKPEEIRAAQVKAQEAQETVGIAEKERSIARINYEEAQREFERRKALYEQSAVSQAEFDEARRVAETLAENLERAIRTERAAGKGQTVAELNAIRAADSVKDNEYLRKAHQAQIAGITAQLDALKNDLEKTTIESPVSGPLLDRFYDEQRVLAAGTPILRMGDMATIEIEADILSEEAGLITVGDPVEITGKAVENQTIIGSVKRVYPSGFKKISSLGIEQQRVKTLISFDNSALNLRPGVSVDIRIITAEKPDALAIPERATFREQGQWYVFVVQRERAVLTPITIGLKNDEWAEVVEGIEDGDVVIAEPKNELKDGMNVTAAS